MSGWTLVLAVWTCLCLVWWSIALVLVAARRAPQPAPESHIDRRRLSVFKPVAAPRTPRERERLRRCLGSFAADLDANSELLIGITDRDWPLVADIVDDLRNDYPAAELKLIVHSLADEYANRKVALNKAIARQASGALWFWSDADIEAPPGTLSSLRRDLAAGGADFVASPYVVREASSPAETLDKLFVNLEFHPGVLLLGRLNQIRFGFGSGMLFEAARFHQRVDWDFLGGSLADDYHLGRLLGTGRLGATRVATLPGARDWRTALLHYLRWHKTIRWCRPASYAAQLLVLPVVGWLLAVVATPTLAAPWLGLAAAVSLDVAFAYAICAVLDARLPLRHLPAATAWSVARAAVWLACWLPWPIYWRGRKWWTHHYHPALAREALEADRGRGV
jgi:hypothetical protein